MVKVDPLRACFLNQTPCNREGTFHSWNSIDFLYTRLGAWNKKVGCWFNYLQVNIHISLHIGEQLQIYYVDNATEQFNYMEAVGRLLLVLETCLIFSTKLSKVGVAHCITHILPCFLQCKIIFKDVLKRIHTLEDILANAFIFNHIAFLKFCITDHHQRSSIVPLAFYTSIMVRLPLMSENISQILFALLLYSFTCSRHKKPTHSPLALTSLPLIQQWRLQHL